MKKFELSFLKLKLIIFFFIFFTLFSMNEVKARDRLPTDLNSLQKFRELLSYNLNRIDIDSSNDYVVSKLTKEIVESLGYDFDKTFIYFLFNRSKFFENDKLKSIYLCVTLPRKNLAFSLKEGIISKKSGQICSYLEDLKGLDLEYASKLIDCSKKYKTLKLSKNQSIRCIMSDAIKPNTPDSELDKVRYVIKEENSTWSSYQGFTFVKSKVSQFKFQYINILYFNDSIEINNLQGLKDLFKKREFIKKAIKESK